MEAVSMFSTVAVVGTAVAVEVGEAALKVA